MIASLLKLNRFQIVYGYQPKRSPFDKTSYIESYVPRVLPYPKQRRPRLAAWDDPKTIWPIIPPSPILPREYLLKQIEKEEMSRLQLIKPLKFPDFRVGDIVEVKWVHNMSEPSMNTYQGLVVARRNRNSLDASFKVIFRHCGIEIMMSFKQNSPYLRDFKLLKRGTGNIRNKQAMWRKLMTKAQTMTPIIKGRHRRRRDDPPKTYSTMIRKMHEVQQIEDPLFKMQEVQESKNDKKNQKNKRGSKK